MARKASKTARRNDTDAAKPRAVKTTLLLSADTYCRLGVEAHCRRVSMSQVAEEVLGPYLRRWRLPSTIDTTGTTTTGGADSAA